MKGMLTQVRSYERSVQLLMVKQFTINLGFYMLMPYLAAHLSGTLGLAGWLAVRFAAPLLMTREEWLFARMLTSDVRDEPPPEAFAYWRAAGWEAERIEAEARVRESARV